MNEVFIFDIYDLKYIFYRYNDMQCQEKIVFCRSYICRVPSLVSRVLVESVYVHNKKYSYKEYD